MQNSGRHLQIRLETRIHSQLFGDGTSVFTFQTNEIRQNRCLKMNKVWKSGDVYAKRSI